MAPELVEMFKTLMLVGELYIIFMSTSVFLHFQAQAQECYVEKSIKFTAGVKYATISKLAAKVTEFKFHIHHYGNQYSSTSIISLCWLIWNQIIVLPW